MVSPRSGYWLDLTRPNDRHPASLGQREYFNHQASPTRVNQAVFARNVQAPAPHSPITEHSLVPCHVPVHARACMASPDSDWVHWTDRMGYE